MAFIVPPVNDLKRRSLGRADGETTLFPTLVVLRQNRVIAAITTPRVEATLGCAHTAAVGLAPQMLALAAQVTLPDGSEGIAYTTMTSDHHAALAVQGYTVTGQDITFDIPQRGEPEDRSIMDELAKALTHAPLDASKVGAGRETTQDGSQGTEPAFIPLERGRMVIDSGTCASLQRSVSGIAGTVLYVSSSPEHATALMAHGMPKEVLVS